MVRDLHDGTLQSLTGIRFQLFAFADVPADRSVMRDRLGAEWQTPVTVRVTPPDLQLRPEIEAEMRMMVREAAINALKQANPSRDSIDVQRDGD